MHPDDNRRLLRARDAIDRWSQGPLDVAALAEVAAMSPSHFARSFRAAFGETPYRYLQRRRIERAMFLLRTTDLPVTDVCFAVGYESLGSFSATFAQVVGTTASEFRLGSPPPGQVPTCFTKWWTRPSPVTGAPPS